MAYSLFPRHNDHSIVDTTFFGILESFDTIGMLDINLTAPLPTLPSQPDRVVAMPIFRSCTNQLTPPSPNPKPTTHKSLLDLPTELRDEVIFWTLARDPKARIPLLMSSKAVDESTTCVAQRAVAEYVKNRYGNAAAMLFTPMAHQIGGEEYVSEVKKVMERINIVVAYMRAQLYGYAGAEAMDVDGAVAMLNLGLYLAEHLQWPQHSSPSDIRRVPASLPPYGVLILRLTSLMIALTCGHRICHELFEAHQENRGRRDNHSVEGLDRDTDSMIRAIEMELLSRGCQNLAIIIGPEVRRRGEQAFPNDGSLLFACARSNEEARKVEAARAEGLDEFVKTVKVVRLYAQFPPGRL